MANPDRIVALAEIFADLGHDGIVAFDETEPEYGTLATLFNRYDSPDHVTLLGVLAASQDYQLNGDAQEFWRQLEEVVTTWAVPRQPGGVRLHALRLWGRKRIHHNRGERQPILRFGGR